MPLPEIYLDLMRRLRELSKKETRLQWLARLGIFMLALSAFALLMPVLAHGVAKSETFRWTLTLCGIGALGYALWRFIAQPMMRAWQQSKEAEHVALALRIGNAHENLRDRFANALQVYEETARGADSDIRHALAGAALKEAYEAVQPLDFTSIIDRKTPRQRIFTGLAAFVICALVWGFAPNYMMEGMQTVLAPQRDPNQQKLNLAVTPGDVEIVKGDGLRVNASIEALADVNANLEWRFTGNNAINQAAMTSLATAPKAEFAHTLEHVRESLSYRVQVGDQTSKWYQVQVVEPPLIQSLRVTIAFPNYTQREAVELDENLGEIAALPGSKVSLRLSSNKELQAGELQFDSGATLPLQLNDNSARAEFVVNKADVYTINLVDKKNLRNPDPIRYRIELETDATPNVRITLPGQDVDVDESMSVPLVIEADDDFGFSSLDIVYELQPSLAGEAVQGRWPLPLANPQQEKITVQALWDLSKLALHPDDVVSYYAEVRDNDTVTGPKSARSETYRVRFPSMYELYEQVAEQHAETSQDLQAMREQVERAKQKLEDVMQELKKNPELDWQQKQKLNESAGATEKMQEQLQAVQERMQEMIDGMQRNDMLSLETLEKYLELQELLQKMDSPELQKALEEMKKAMEQVDPQKLADALKNFQFSQEEFLKSIERTMNLLKQLHAEQKLDEALKKTEDLLARQEEVNKEAAQQPSQEKREELAAEESQMSEDTKSLEQALKDLEKMLEEMKQAPASKVDAAAQMMQNQDLAGEMQQMAAQMQQNQMQQAQQSGKRAASTLQRMQESLQDAQKEMRESQQRYVMQALQRSSSDLLQLSKQQEQLGQQSGSMNRSGTQFNEAADRQQELLSGMQRVTNQLYELSQKSFAVTPEVARALGQSMNQMQEALNSLEQQDAQNAGQAQAQAMQGLDAAVAGLREGMKNMGSSGSMGMGADEFMQRLLGLSGQQQGINQESQQMGQQGMSMQQQAAMARLAAQQAAVQKSLEQLLQEFGNKSEILGRLDQTAKDMEEVAKDLQQQKIDRQTLDRQQRILSRMLDAQRSMREREYKDERQAERGKNYRALDPGALPEDLGERKTKIQEDLLRALRENYSRDYRALIQKYFEALTKEGQKGR